MHHDIFIRIFSQRIAEKSMTLRKDADNKKRRIIFHLSNYALVHQAFFVEYPCQPFSWVLK